MRKDRLPLPLDPRMRMTEIVEVSEKKKFLPEIKGNIPSQIESGEKEYAWFLTKLMDKKKRFENSKSHVQEGEKLGWFSGFLGQQVFRALLLEWKIPHLSADPIYGNELTEEYRSINGKIFDFYVKDFGSIEVKTVQPDKKRGFGKYFKNLRDAPRIEFQVDVERFHNCDYYVGMKIYDSKYSVMCGYLTGDEVKKLPHPYGKYVTLLKNMHPAEKFKDMLKEHSIENDSL